MRQKSNLFPKFFHEEKGKSFLALGATKQFYSLSQKLLEEPEVFGGVDFSGNPYFFSPLEKEEGFVLSKITSLPKIKQISHSPTQEEWEIAVSKALRWIEEGRGEKIVLARKTRVECAGAIDPWNLLAHLPLYSRFLLQKEDGVSFLGSSPEKLYVRNNRILKSDALAGTIFPGNRAPTSKLLAELDFVKTYLKGQLAPLSSSLSWQSKDKLQPFQHLYHFANRATATLKKGISDIDLLRALHPTPATLGVAKEAAKLFLKENETFARHWYAGAVGWISKSKANFTVAIRSSTVQNSTLTLFAGVGIVKGSQAGNEWEELNSKIKHYLELF